MTNTYNPALDESREDTIAGLLQVLSVARWNVRREEPQTEETEELAPFDDMGPERPEPLAAGYTLRKVIARGGFGEIWEATQEVLSRVVAVKRLRQDLIDRHKSNPAMLRRLETAFRQESLVAAYLEHPNILPVHDLGVDAAGHLLLATKLVRGKPWDALITQDRSLPLEDFLERHLPILESVARAVGFAHARGIVHRDLKPQQVMVGEFGEVLLMDWGIAIFISDKEQNPPPLAEALGPIVPTRLTASNPAGTVVYMAPEQTEGNVSNVGPWTDIYLLGGILYELLTGRLPHQADSRTRSFYAASLGIVASPWEVCPGKELPETLVSLAMSCLEPRREDRLASAEEFILLLGEYHRGASRRREALELLRSANARASEANDYRALAHAQSVVTRALSLWPGHAEGGRLLDALTLRYAKLALGNHDLKLARLQAERLPEYHAERSDLLAEVDRLEEKQARARERLDEAYRRAREAYSRADRLVTFLLDDLHTSLQEVNRLDLMGQVGREALDYFDSLAEEESTPEVMAKRAGASRNIGDVFRDQGNLGGAAAAFRTYQELAQRLVALDGGDTRWRALLASALERLSGIEYLRGNLDESLRLLEDGLALAKTLPPDTEHDYLTGKLTHQKGIVLWRRRQLDAAQEQQEASLAIFARLAAADPERTEFRQAHGWNLSTLGNVQRDQGNLAEAIRLTEEGLEIRRALSLASPDHKVLQDDLCWSMTNLALLREYTGDFTGALETFQQAEMLRRRLVLEDPTNAVHRNKLTFILSSIGRNLYGLGRYADAIRHTEESSGISRRIVEGDPSNVHEVGSHALNLGYAGLALLHGGRIAAARTILLESRPAANRALQAVPENGVYQNALCQALILEGQLARLDGIEAHARACWEEALLLLEKQSWRRGTGQGMGMHLELSLLLGRREDALADVEELRKNNWMMPRWEGLLGEG